jgi:predicted nucleic acid-binding protein
MSEVDATATITRFEHDLENDLLVFNLTADVITSAARLADKHALRGYDAVQLAVALEINAARIADQLPRLLLISSDADLNAAAQIEGLSSDDPNLH